MRSICVLFYYILVFHPADGLISGRNRNTWLTRVDTYPLDILVSKIRSGKKIHTYQHVASEGKRNADGDSLQRYRNDSLKKKILHRHKSFAVSWVMFALPKILFPL